MRKTVVLFLLIMIAALTDLVYSKKAMTITYAHKSEQDYYQTVYEKAKRLADQGNYLNAYKTLDSVKESNSILFLLEKKTILVISFNTQHNERNDTYLLSNINSSDTATIYFPYASLFHTLRMKYPEQSCTILHVYISLFASQALNLSSANMKENGRRLSDTLKAVIAAGCANYETYHYASMAAYYIEDYAKSLEYGKQAIALNENFAIARLQIASSYQQLNQPKEALLYALKAFEQLDINYKKTTAYFIGGLYYALYDSINSLQWYTIADDLPPSITDSSQLWKWLKVAATFEKKEETTTLYKIINKLRNLNDYKEDEKLVDKIVTIYTDAKQKEKMLYFFHELIKSGFYNKAFSARVQYYIDKQ